MEQVCNTPCVLEPSYAVAAIVHCIYSLYSAEHLQLSTQSLSVLEAAESIAHKGCDDEFQEQQGLQVLLPPGRRHDPQGNDGNLYQGRRSAARQADGVRLQQARRAYISFSSPKSGAKQDRIFLKRIGR